MIEILLNWEWRDATTLWFVLAPAVWGAISFWLRRRQTSQYAESHLLPWAKVTEQSLFTNAQYTKALAQKQTSKTARPGRFLLRQLGHLFRPKWLLTLAWICLIIALAGPRTLVPSPQESTRAGVDILVALDTSRSMLVQDVAPNRFLLAKSLVESLANRLEPNDRLGLMVYAGRPHLVSPLSFDRALFQHYLDLMRPGILPTLGSQLDSAIMFGAEHLQQTAGKSQVLLVLTNGTPEPDQIVAVPEGLKAVANTATKVILAGVGNLQPSRIPSMEHPSGALHASGLLVTSRLEQIALQKLATQLNGVYLRANNDAAFLDRLVEEVSVLAKKRSFQSALPVWQDHAMPFIWGAFFALLWAFFPVRIGRSVQPNILSLLGVAVLSSVLFYTPGAWALDETVGQEIQAYKAFNAKDYDASQQAYDGLHNYRGWFGAGAAAYKAEDYESSVFYFREAALNGVTDKQRAQALFNLGNSFYQANLTRQAIEAYEQALVYWPNYEKAEHNLALAKRKRQKQKGQQQDQEQGDGQGDGNTSRDAEGAFYGGQKPNQDEAGEGVSGDAPEGEKDGKEFVLPDEPEETDFSLSTANSLQLNDTANAILDQQKRVYRMEKFEHEMQRVEDNQARLLQNIFEREEGFQATQNQSHPLPGVKPW